MSEKPFYTHISDISGKTLVHINDRKKGLIKSIITPYTKFNTYNGGGVQFGDLTIIGGMSGSGKTAIASQLKRKLHELNPELTFALLIFTFEMPGYKLLLRDIVAETKIRRNELLSIDPAFKINEYQQDLVDSYLEDVNQQNIYFVEKPCTVDDYVVLCDKLRSELNMNIIAIADHSLLFKKKKGTDREMLMDVSENIMELKNEGWSSHFILSQLNRDIESPVRRTPCSPFNYPMKSDLTSSDSLYQTADNVIISHRPYMLKFAPNTYGPDKLPCDKEDVYFHCLKLRESEPLELKMRGVFSEMRIEDDLGFINN